MTCKKQGVKRVDSPGELEKAFMTAMSMSRSKIVIIEEFIKQAHKYMIGGDCFVLNGKVEFWGLLNCHRNPLVNPLVPVGKSYPLLMNEGHIEEVYSIVQSVVDLLDIKFGGFNLELIFDNCGKLYLIEMGPRSGGNMIPDLLQMITGVDLIAATVEAALGNTSIDLNYEPRAVFYATHNLHIAKDGIFECIEFSSEIENRIMKKVIYKKPGDPVQFFDGADKVIGIVFMKFPSMEDMFKMVEHIQTHINIKISSIQK